VSKYYKNAKLTKIVSSPLPHQTGEGEDEGRAEAGVNFAVELDTILERIREFDGDYRRMMQQESVNRQELEQLVRQITELSAQATRLRRLQRGQAPSESTL
jgi:hypothetical protein